MIDISVSPGYWPLHLCKQLSLVQVRDELAAEGIEAFFPSAAECVLAPDPGPYNRRLIEDADGHPSIFPLPVINPRLNGWEENLENYLEAKTVKAVKIIPNYHYYCLQSGFLGPLVRHLASRLMPLVIQMRIDDERNHHVRMQVPAVPVNEVVSLHHRFPEHPIVCLNLYWREAIELCRRTRNVYIDSAFAEHYETFNTLLKVIPAGRIMFGSHSPFLYTRSAVMKLSQAPISTETRRLIASENARALFKI